MTYNYKGEKVYIIAEAGVNHNGNVKIAKKLIDVAVNAKADAVKFQTFKAENLASKFAVKANYQKKTTSKEENQLSMLKRLELKNQEYLMLKNYCKKKKIDFITTAFDHDSLEFITKKLKVKILKIPSGEITNGPLILSHALKKKKIILSTGMSTLKEIENALNIISFGFQKKNTLPSIASFKKNKFSQKLLKKNVTILHCSTEYPLPFSDVNLNAMITIKKKFGIDVGYSDHTKGILVPIIATSMGAKIIEKHFTLNKNMKGPDHKASLDPLELKNMVLNIRIAEMIKGDYEKKAYLSEIKNIEIARKSLVAKKKINPGEKFTKKNLTVKRPATGISPMKYWDFLGKKSKKKYDEDEIIK